MSEKTIGIIGGDIRMFHMGEAFKRDNYRVLYSGFESINSIPCADLLTTARSDYIVFPLPPTRDGKTICAPLSDKKIAVNSDLSKAIGKRPVFCGMAEKLKIPGTGFENIKYYDYYEHSDFAVKNAVPTANAALSIVRTFYKGNGLVNTPVLILGYGRVGKACAKAFKAAFAQVYAGARKDSDFKKIKADGYIPENSVDIENPGKYKIIINTVPNMLLNRQVLEKLDKDTVIIDLASGAGGTDFNAADDLNIKAIHALSLPGKYYPEEAGTIIKETITKIIKEEAL